MIVGVAGADYPTYSRVPDTSFRCEDQETPGYYADEEAECQVFHICVSEGRRVRQYSFLCPNGTVFSQQYLEDSLALEEDSLALEEDSLALEEDSLALEEDSLVLEVDSLVLEEDSLALEGGSLALEGRAYVGGIQ
ncbi:U-scoloptoxin(01)-Cw1a-like 29, partial [Homarus americanus]